MLKICDRTTAAAVTLLLGALEGSVAAQVLANHEHGEAGGRLGDVMARLDDLDGDGIDDLLVGERLYDGPSHFNVGRASLYSGATLALIRAHEGGKDFDEFGTAVSAAGDVDGDGVGDYAIGSPGDDSKKSGGGKVVVISGATGFALWTAYGAANSEKLGERLASIADLDGDGRGELIVGLPLKSEARLFDASGNLLLTLSDVGGTSFGQAVASCGDVDGDGRADFLVSATTFGRGPGFDFLGRVDVFSGATAALIGSFEGDHQDDRLGWSVAGIGDVDGDGVPDLMAGAANASTVATSAGYVRVVSGSTRATLRTDYGAGSDDKFGWSCAKLGDFDGDGIDDYAAGAIGGGASSLGSVRVYSGATGATLFEFEGFADSIGSNTFFGQSVVGGDFDGDGLGDLAIGDHYYVDAATLGYVGGVWVYRGCPAWWANYGAGWPGKNGIPQLVALNDPVVGGPVDVQIGNSLGATTLALLLVGTSQVSVPTTKGGTLLATEDVVFQLFSLDAAGTILSGDIPADPALYFTDYYVQVLEADPFASQRISFTPGLKLRCGFDL